MLPPSGGHLSRNGVPNQPTAMPHMPPGPLDQQMRVHQLVNGPEHVIKLDPTRGGDLLDPQRPERRREPQNLPRRGRHPPRTLPGQMHGHLAPEPRPELPGRRDQPRNPTTGREHPGLEIPLGQRRKPEHEIGTQRPERPLDNRRGVPVGHHDPHPPLLQPPQLRDGVGIEVLGVVDRNDGAKLPMGQPSGNPVKLTGREMPPLRHGRIEHGIGRHPELMQHGTQPPEPKRPTGSGPMPQPHDIGVQLPQPPKQSRLPSPGGPGNVHNIGPGGKRLELSAPPDKPAPPGHDTVSIAPSPPHGSQRGNGTHALFHVPDHRQVRPPRLR